MVNLNKKLFDLRKEVGAISKKATNPFYKSQYFDINQLLKELQPLFETNNLLCLQPIKDGKVTTIIIDVESNESVSSEMPLPDLTDPQKLGSAITYYRRYTLQSLLGLQSEDDDGNKASTKTELPWLNEGSDQWKKMLRLIEVGRKITITQIQKEYKISVETKERIEELLKLYSE